jgi:signal transduction histidine kinase
VNETHPLFARRLTRRQLIMLDLAAALAFSFVLFTTTAGSAALPPWARIAVPMALGLPLALRRVWPLATFIGTLTIAVVAVMGDVTSFAYFSPGYAIYLVAVAGSRGTWLPTSTIGILALVTGAGLVLVGGTPQAGAPEWLLGVDKMLVGVAVLGGAWTLGRAIRERRIYAAHDAERMALQAVAEERLRIARELHDVVTHNVGLIAVKAGVANHVLAVRPEEAYDALRVIETASRSALVEMRHLLGVLRSTDTPDRGPAPGLSGLNALVDRAEQAGVKVDLNVRVPHDVDDHARPPEKARKPDLLSPTTPRPGGIHGARVSPPRGTGAESVNDAGTPYARLNARPTHHEGEHHRAEEELGSGDEHPFTGAADRLGGEHRRMEPTSEVEERGVSGGRDSVPGRGAERRLPEGVELSVYRIVQEALTNVVKHAAPARCRVSVIDDGGSVRIEVSDDGPGQRMLPGEGPGHGLIGMRERVMMYGGSFEAGGLPKRGFRVSAHLPYGRAS